jgi:predicted amidohydrolase
MVLPGYALMAMGTQIHVAAWPFSWHLDPVLNNAPLLSQVFAAQGGCYVMATSSLLRVEDVQEAYRELAASRIGDWTDATQGGSRIIAPGGEVIARAKEGEETILTATVSLEAVLKAKAAIDVGGHYSRPDVLQLHINRRPLARLVESDSLDRSRDTADNHAAHFDPADVQRQEAANSG